MSGDQSPTIRMVNGRRMQCKDIPDVVFLDAVRRAKGTANFGWRTRWEVHAELELAAGPVPENLLMAKARGLIRRRLMDGCACGCRGDWCPVGNFLDTLNSTLPEGMRLEWATSAGMQMPREYDARVAAAHRRAWSGPDGLERQILRAYGVTAQQIGSAPRSAFSSEYRQRQRNRVKRGRR